MIGNKNAKLAKIDILRRHWRQTIVYIHYEATDNKDHKLCKFAAMAEEIPDKIKNMMLLYYLNKCTIANQIAFS